MKVELDEAQAFLRDSNIEGRIIMPEHGRSCEMNHQCRCLICVEWAMEVVKEHEKQWSGYGGTWDHPGHYD